MSDRKLSISVKGGVGYEAPLLSLGGDSVEELNFQMEQVMSQGTLGLATALALRFQNGYREGRHEAPAQQGQQTPPAAQRTQQRPPAQRPPEPWENQDPADPWGTQSPAADPWANRPQPAQGQGRGAPNGNPVCQCGQVMEFKQTAGGKNVWRCPEWRWNNGNPNTNHDQAWPDDPR